MFYIDTYDVATMGQNSFDTATRASNGILVSILIEDIIEAPTRAPGGASGYKPYEDTKKEKKKDKKRITVIVNIAGVDYKEVKIVEDKPNLRVEDIDVIIKETVEGPKIKIQIL